MALEDELSCPVCTELFRDPVLLSCGHSFCRQCINAHWTSSSSRNCPVCRQVSPQEPVSNLSLRNTCEAFLREKSTRKEWDEEHECLIHGEKVELFCQTDEEVLCSECKKHEHAKHKIQPLQQAVRQRKEKLKAALRPAEKTLWSLQNSAAQDAKICNFNQSQVQQTEKRIKEEFKKLQQFLKKEEESRIAALNEEEKQKRAKIEKRTKGRIRSLSDRLGEVEERMKDDDVTFLQNYNSIMNRAKCTLPDQELSSETLIDVSKHLGNLKYQVWDNMKDICPYYPVILNPHTTPADFSVSDDLTAVTSCVHRQDKSNAFPLNRSRMVLGSVGYGIGTHTWQIEMRNSRHWSLGVCFRSEGKPITQPLSPENGFWGLRRDGCMYSFLSTPTRFSIKTNPEVVQVRLEDDYDVLGRWQRKVSFSDARSDSHFAKITGVPAGKELFPFVIPEDQSVPLRVVPVPAKITLAGEQVERNLSFQERYKGLIEICFGFLVIFIFL
ncbi:tripartite motif-containing protein 35-like [Sinocyclocheilus grahami]|uniref:tripartite motif-containing protein 35-like n=1 Tax=Sinocyclocheilus grahami TaxID=75366 RepID=UPI0007ACC379|nr:PREDICTED: tripartite motif-containing protein 35-like [Sinocyclocheilus grahami]